MHVQYLVCAFAPPLPQNIHAVIQVPHKKLTKAPFRKLLQTSV